MKGEARREQILEAATRVFADHGYEKASIGKICSLVGIARGTLYQYFEDKQRLFRELLEDYAGRILEYMRPLDLAAADFPAPLEFLYRKNLVILKEIDAHREVYKILMREAMAKNPDTEDLVLRVHRSFIESLRRDLETGVRIGAFVLPDPEFAAVYLFGGIVETVERYIFDGENRMPPEVLAGKLAEFQMRFLKP